MADLLDMADGIPRRGDVVDRNEKHKRCKNKLHLKCDLRGRAEARCLEEEGEVVLTQSTSALQNPATNALFRNSPSELTGAPVGLKMLKSVVPHTL